ncbi:ral guanine nucleotide dissociation stimulator isoform X3 [Lates japonicus]|uniref:Ral guanine nucleotide dissociation stimulator isoform X3 n=1 Tax=Lates japonicus TaxID=270547 RepID=A0AAD3NKT7_LATJO|nr:ral guanine nucleotide dissociation stimulator isoform X3 [Lates japonicus]
MKSRLKVASCGVTGTLTDINKKSDNTASQPDHIPHLLSVNSSPPCVPIDRNDDPSPLQSELSQAVTCERLRPRNAAVVSLRSPTIISRVSPPVLTIIRSSYRRRWSGKQGAAPESGVRKPDAGDRRGGRGRHLHHHALRKVAHQSASKAAMAGRGRTHRASRDLHGPSRLHAWREAGMPSPNVPAATATESAEDDCTELRKLSATAPVLPHPGSDLERRARNLPAHFHRRQQCEPDPDGEHIGCPFATQEESGFEDELPAFSFLSFDPIMVAEQFTLMDASGDSQETE